MDAQKGFIHIVARKTSMCPMTLQHSSDHFFFSLQALRQKKYTEKNPLMAKLSQTRKRVALIKKRRSYPEFDLAYKKKIN